MEKRTKDEALDGAYRRGDLMKRRGLLTKPEGLV